MLAFTLRAFDELSTSELYEVLALRQRVFVVEQKCAYLDCDGKDLRASHLLGRQGKDLVAYARLLPRGASYEESSIGRVASDPSVRGSGCGRELIREAIARTWETFGGPIYIGAQRYLERFYAEVGFVVVGEPYDEDGIPHIHMRLDERAEMEATR
jgi:ElaA protein